MKKALLALAVAGAAVSAQADVSLSGHVNYVIGNIEDIADTSDGKNGDPTAKDVEIRNGSTSGSRFRIKTSKKAANGIVYGTNHEFGTGTSVSVRNTFFYLKGAFGKLSLGQGSDAGDGAAEADFSGTYVLSAGAQNSWGLDKVVGSVDGGRDENLRYDSPKLGGVATVSLSIADNDDTQIAVKGGTKNIKFGIFSESKDEGDADSMGYSLAGKFGGFTAAYQGGDVDGSRDFSRVILGYRSGAYSVAVDMTKAEYEDDVSLSFQGESITGGVDVETTGLSFVYRPTKGVELYAGIRNAEGSVSGVSADEDGYLLGGRVKF